MDLLAIALDILAKLCLSILTEPNNSSRDGCLSRKSRLFLYPV